MGEIAAPVAVATPVASGELAPGNLTPLAPRKNIAEPTKSAAVIQQQENFKGKGLDAERTPNNTITPELKQKLDNAEAAKRLRPFWKRGDARAGIYDIINTKTGRRETAPTPRRPERQSHGPHTPLKNTLHPDVPRQRPTGDAATQVDNRSRGQRPANRLAGGRQEPNVPAQYQLQEIRQKPKGKYDLVDKDGYAVRPSRTTTTEGADRFQLEDPRKPGNFDLVDRKTGKLMPRARQPRNERGQNTQRRETSTSTRQAENSGTENRNRRPQNTVESRFLQNRMTEWNRTNPYPKGDPILEAAWENRRKIALGGFKDMALTHALEVQYEKTKEPHPARKAKDEKRKLTDDEVRQWIYRKNEWVYGKRDPTTGEQIGGEKNRIETQRDDYKKKEEARKKAAADAKTAAANPTAATGGTTTPTGGKTGGTPAAAQGTKPAGEAATGTSAPKPDAARSSGEQGSANPAAKEKADSEDKSKDKPKTEGAKSAETEAAKERAGKVQKYIDDITQMWDGREPEDPESPEHDRWEQGRSYAEDQAEIDANAFIDLLNEKKTNPNFAEPDKSKDRPKWDKWAKNCQIYRQQRVQHWEGQNLRELPRDQDPHLTLELFSLKKKVT